VAESITVSSGKSRGKKSGGPARPPFWRNVRVLRVVVQIVALVAVLLTLRWLFDNLVTGLDEQGIPTSFDFLDSPAGFAVRDSSFSSDSPVRDLIWVGVRNTLAVSIVGIALALVIGTLVGVGRLSTNWLVRKLATIYVETFRNIPVLVIIIFFGFALFTFGPLPAFNPTSPPKEIGIPGTDLNFAIVSKSRLGFLSITNQDHAAWFWAIVLVGGLIALLVWLWRTQVNVNTGKPHHRVAFALVTFIGISVVGFLILGRPVAWSSPEVSDSGRIIVGGLATNDGYIALTLALGVYTASHIAEIIRGSILAVPRGQGEAANALALSSFQRYRFVVLPQAMRIALPPIINQFLNLVKNSSLATAVAFPEITAVVKTAIGNGNPAPQLVLVLMGCYLVFSLFISLILNIVNRRSQPVGR